MPKTSDIPELSPRRGRRNLRLVGGVVITGLFVLLAVFADFLAPYSHDHQSRNTPRAPATTVHFSARHGPVIYPLSLADPLRFQYEEDRSRPYPLGFFVRGDRYKFLGIIDAERHLFGVAEPGPDAPRIHLLGTDALGRDRLSRLLHAVRFSLIVAPLGMLLASLIGILMGIISGYATRGVDTFLMGAADAMLSLPALVLILAARAAFPLELPPMRAGLLLVTIFAVVGWAEMARLTRSLVRSVREREFVLAAKASGLTGGRILFRHILPNISRPLITQATLILPAFLLAEVALSFLGVGLQEPVPSLGNMLAAAADLTQLRQHPFLLLAPAIVIFVFIFGVRLLADGLEREKV
ncbi:MAG TPA: ABC transporter permease [Pyrinomonadaceae bacterium]|nr:ABC transporter permease [Pyrinomonadaceae bacterium]